MKIRREIFAFSWKNQIVEKIFGMFLRVSVSRKNK